jgi:hypothetical protein
MMAVRACSHPQINIPLLGKIGKPRGTVDCSPEWRQNLACFSNRLYWTFEAETESLWFRHFPAHNLAENTLNGNFLLDGN